MTRTQRSAPPKVLSHRDYRIGWICALQNEKTAAVAMLDEIHATLGIVAVNDTNDYTLGSIGPHNIVIACIPPGQMGTVRAANVVTRLVNSFPDVQFGLMVGIGGGVPGGVLLKIIFEIRLITGM